MEIVKLRLRDLQPSQFYISAGKLKAIERPAALTVLYFCRKAESN